MPAQEPSDPGSFAALMTPLGAMDTISACPILSS